MLPPKCSASAAASGGLAGARHELGVRRDDRCAPGIAASQPAGSRRRRRLGEGLRRRAGGEEGVAGELAVALPLEPTGAEPGAEVRGAAGGAATPWRRTAPRGAPVRARGVRGRPAARRRWRAPACRATRAGAHAPLRPGRSVRRGSVETAASCILHRPSRRLWLHRHAKYASRNDAHCCRSAKSLHRIISGRRSLGSRP